MKAPDRALARLLHHVKDRIRGMSQETRFARLTRTQRLALFLLPTYPGAIVAAPRGVVFDESTVELARANFHERVRPVVGVFGPAVEIRVRWEKVKVARQIAQANSKNERVP